jgi:membrane-associated phospholipid phosphatase
VESTIVARAAQAVAAPRRRRAALPSLSWSAPIAYFVALGIAVAFRGLPTSRDALFFWVLLGLLAASATNVRRWFRGVLVDWLPFGIILFAYDLLRGYADEFLSASIWPQLRADEIAFGTVPTVWLQQRLWDGPAGIDWIDYAAWSVYITHFFATFLVAGALWLFASRLFRRYIAAVSLLALTGFATYALFPAVPPWMASRDGHLETTDRIVRFVSSDVPVGYFGALWEQGSQYANDVAAVPSLHAAYALLIALFLWRFVAWPWRVALAAYAVAMGFALVYTSEHYVSDVVVGWLYAAGALVVVERVFRRRASA